MTHLYPQTPRSSPTREAHRVSYDQETADAVLDEAFVCHVGFVVEGRPVVLPHLHVRITEVLYLHGSTGARAMQAARGASQTLRAVRREHLERFQHASRGADPSLPSGEVGPDGPAVSTQMPGDRGDRPTLAT